MRGILPKIVGLAAYLAFVGGLGALCLEIAGHAGGHVMALAAPYLDAKRERPLTLVERRARALQASTVVAEARPDDAPVVPLEAPAIPLKILAASLDKAERADLLNVRPQGPRRARRARAQPPPVRVAAADVFGRSFGVMLRVSR